MVAAVVVVVVRRVAAGLAFERSGVPALVAAGWAAVAVAVAVLEWASAASASMAYT